MVVSVLLIIWRFEMKIAVVGSRSFSCYDQVKKVLSGLAITLIVSGGAIGADSLAEKFAEENNIPKKIFLPDWAKFGRGAGMVRNKDIVTAADMVVAFWDGKSKGTKNTIDTARKLGKKVEVVYV